MTISLQQYAKFAEHLLDEYKDRITGANVDVVYEQEPIKLFMVGRLASEMAVSSSRNRDSSICAIGIDFYLREDELPLAELEIIPGGELYYRVFPSLEEQRQSFHRSWERAVRLGEADSRDVAKASLESWSADVLPVYAKKRIDNLRLRAKLRDIYNSEERYGMTDLRSAIDPYIDALGEDIQADPRFYHVIREKCRAVDLQDEAAWENFIKTRSEEYMRPIWNFAVTCEIRPHTTGLLRVSVRFTNTSSAGGVTRDYRINTIFNSSLEIRLDGARYNAITMEYFADDYKYDRTLDKNALSEYIFPNIPAFLIYCQNVQGVNLGALFNLFEVYFHRWLSSTIESIQTCIFDPLCIDEEKACVGCLFLNEISCIHFNHDLDRRLLVGWRDKSSGELVKGFWEGV